MRKTISTKIVKTKKDHFCFGCGRKFESGTEMRRSVVVDYNIWNFYLCKTCQTVLERDKEIVSFAFGGLRSEALQLEKE